jgi:hypothetical protein
VSAIPVILSLTLLVLADSAHNVEFLANWGCVLIVVIFTAIIVAELKWKAAPYVVMLPIILSIWRSLQPTIFAVKHASIWITLMIHVRLYAIASRNNFNSFSNATRDVCKAVFH